MTRPVHVGALGAIVAIYIAAGWVGIDFGLHWDEHWIQSAWKQTLTEGAYRSPRPYPGFYFDLSLPALGVAALAGDDPAQRLEIAGSPAFLLAVRRLFVVLHALSIVGTFLLVRRLRGDVWEAVLTAAVIGLSWQFSYHGRWLAPDASLAVCAAFAVWSSLEARRRGTADDKWLCAAAVLAGFTMAGKYPGGLALVPVAWVAVRGEAGWFARAAAIRRLVTVAGVFGLTFLIASPHVWIDFDLALMDIRGQVGQYGAGGHLGHSVEPGLPHLSLMLAFLLHCLSPIDSIGLALGGLAIVGAYRLARSGGEAAAITMVLPVSYLLFFAIQRLLIVRNLLILLPFVAGLVAVGITEVRRQITRVAGPRFSAGFVACVLAMLVAHAVWILWAGVRVRDYRPADGIAALVKEIEAHPEQSYRVSPQIAAEFARLGRTPSAGDWSPFERSALPDDRARVAIRSSEYRILGWSWPANRRGVYQDLGPPDVDWDFYPGFPSQIRVVVLSGADYKRIQSTRGAR